MMMYHFLYILLIKFCLNFDIVSFSVCLFKKVKMQIIILDDVSFLVFCSRRATKTTSKFNWKWLHVAINKCYLISSYTADCITSLFLNKYFIYLEIISRLMLFCLMIPVEQYLMVAFQILIEHSRNLLS